jgi:hypothetical protein
MRLEDVIKSINNFVEKEGLCCEYDENHLRYDFSFQPEGVISLVRTNLVIDYDGDGCLFTTYPEIGIVERTRGELEHLLFQINCHIYRGMWQIAFDEIRYVKSLVISGDDAVLTDEMLGECIYAGGNVVEHYADAIVAVISGASTAEVELQKLFGSDGEDDEDAEEEEMEDAEEEEDATSKQSVNEISEETAESIILWLKGDKDDKK